MRKPKLQVFGFPKVLAQAEPPGWWVGEKNFRKRWQCKGLRWRHLLQIKNRGNNNGEWRRRLRNLKFRISPPQKMCAALQEVLAPELRSYVHVGSWEFNRYKLSCILWPFVLVAHKFKWPTTAGPQTSNPNQVGGTLCISIASTALFGGYLRFSISWKNTFHLKLRHIVALSQLERHLETTLELHIVT